MCRTVGGRVVGGGGEVRHVLHQSGRTRRSKRVSRHLRGEFEIGKVGSAVPTLMGVDGCAGGEDDYLGCLREAYTVTSLLMSLMLLLMTMSTAVAIAVTAAADARWWEFNGRVVVGFNLAHFGRTFLVVPIPAAFYHAMIVLMMHHHGLLIVIIGHVMAKGFSRYLHLHQIEFYAEPTQNVAGKYECRASQCYVSK